MTMLRALQRVHHIRRTARSRVQSVISRVPPQVEDYTADAAIKARAAAKDGSQYHFELASDEEDDDLGPSLTRRRGSCAHARLLI